MTSPYLPPPLSDIVQGKPYIYGRIAGGLFAFACTAFVAWLLIITTCVPDTEAFLPICVSMIPACLCGLLVFWVFTRGGTPILFSLYIVSTCSLVAMLMIGYSFVPDGYRCTPVPSSKNGIAPVHWLLITFAIASICFGTFSQTGTKRKLRVDARITLIVALLFAFAYVAWWALGAYSAATNAR